MTVAIPLLVLRSRSRSLEPDFNEVFLIEAHQILGGDMHHAANAYRRVAQHTASPRDLEAQLLLRAAARLQTIHDDWEIQKGGLDDALLFNRNLWIVFLTSVTSCDNPLPAAIRQNIANIGLFVMHQTLSLEFAPTQEGLRSLIRINKQISAGLGDRT